MNAATKLSALNRFRSAAAGLVRQLTTKILVVYDVQIKNPEVSHVPLVINYGEFYSKYSTGKIILTWFAFLDLPKAVEEYAHRYGVHNFVYFLRPSSHILPPVLLLLLLLVMPVPASSSTLLLPPAETLKCSGL
jgi:hypothetical protein